MKHQLAIEGLDSSGIENHFKTSNDLIDEMVEAVPGLLQAYNEQMNTLTDQQQKVFQEGIREFMQSKIL